MIHRALAIISMTALLMVGGQSYAAPENGKLESVAMSPRLQTLFAKTKQVCFGRYAMEVPAEANLGSGAQYFPWMILTHVGEAGQLKKKAEAYRANLAQDSAVEITYFGQGPVSSSIQVRYFRNKAEKQLGKERGVSFIAAGPHLFEWSGARTSAELIRNLRARDNADNPIEPGVCINHGFVADTSGEYQEDFGAGIDLPSLPNVSFGVRSNKRVDAPNGEGLLDLISRQKKNLGDRYPKLTTLREGQRTVGVWQGEESLVRNPDGTHSFDWVAVSKERSTLHPAWIHANMQTEVVAADKASLSDEEAIVLWDKLLEGVHFRVNAPPTQTGDMIDHNGVVAMGSPKIQTP